MPIKLIKEIFFIPLVQNTNISLFSSYRCRITNNVKKLALFYLKVSNISNSVIGPIFKAIEENRAIIDEINSGILITMIIILQEQCGNTKQIKNIIEIPFTKEFHNYLFRPDLLHRDDLVTYDSYIRGIEHGPEARQREELCHKGWKEEMQEECELGITINPKVDSKKQRRVQCSFSLKNKNIQKFIKRDSLLEFNKPNICRNIEIPLSIASKKRK